MGESDCIVRTETNARTALLGVAALLAAVAALSATVATLLATVCVSVSNKDKARAIRGERTATLSATVSALGGICEERVRRPERRKDGHESDSFRNQSLQERVTNPDSRAQEMERDVPAPPCWPSDV